MVTKRSKVHLYNTTYHNDKLGFFSSIAYIFILSEADENTYGLVLTNRSTTNDYDTIQQHVGFRNWTTRYCPD